MERWKRDALGTAAGLALVLCVASYRQSFAAVPPQSGPTSEYANKEFGVTFQYLRNYQMTEGDLHDSQQLGYMGAIPMEFVALGGKRMVTIQPPPGSYPGTDFVNSFFTVSTNQYLTSAECEQLPDWVAGAREPIYEKVSGIELRGLSQAGVGLGHQYGGYYYHGFAEGTCFEVGYGIATAGYGAVDGLKKVNDRDALSILENIFHTLSVRPPKSALDNAGSPVIQSFSVAETSTADLPHTYRVSWNVKDAAADQLSLSVSCFKDGMGYPFRVLRITGQHAEGTPFPCDEMQPLESSRGALELKFEHMSSDELDESVRLFAAGKDSVSETLTISLPALPVMWGVGESRFYGNETPPTFNIQAGHEVKINGWSFLPKDVLWIGSTSVPVDVPNGKDFVFTVPTSVPEGVYPLFLTDEHGKGNSVMVRVIRRRPQFALNHFQPAILCNGNSVILPGNEVRVRVIAGLLPTNTVWLGTSSLAGVWRNSSPNDNYLYFTAPASLAPGQYPFYVTNELGKSDMYTVTVGAN